MSSAKVDIVIVNWNSGTLASHLLDSLELVADKESIGQVIIVDNASSDDSLTLIEKHLELLPLTLIRSDKNLGFAKACNLGAQRSKEKYLLFLNPDTLIYESSISKSIDFLENDLNSEYGACGIQLVDSLNIPNRSCARIPDFKNFLFSCLGLNTVLPKQFPGVLLKEWGHNETKDIGHVIGAFYMVRSKLFKKFGGFDERFFLYYEDLDFSTTLEQNSYKIAFLSEIRAVHIGGGCSQKIRSKRLSYSYLSKLKYIRKHFPWWQATLLTIVVLTLEPIMRFCFYLLRFSFKEAFISLKGYLEFIANGIARALYPRRHA